MILNVDTMHPDDALNEARGIASFLESATCAFFEAGVTSLPRKDGLSGLVTITILLNDLLKRAGERA